MARESSLGPDADVNDSRRGAAASGLRGSWTSSDLDSQARLARQHFGFPLSH